LQAAIAALAEHRIGAVVVLGADRRVIGLLSERDVVRAFAEFGADALSKRLAQVMTREVATCGEGESADSDFFNEEQRTADTNDALQIADRLHANSGRFFRWCISDALHLAMEPSDAG
jgi:hypothetical protein